MTREELKKIAIEKAATLIQSANVSAIFIDVHPDPLDDDDAFVVCEYVLDSERHETEICHLYKKGEWFPVTTNA